MWLNHLNLRHDPFAGREDLFVPLPGHREAVARLAHAIEGAERFVWLHAPAGLGKTRVLERALAETHSPARRTVRVSCPSHGSAWLLDLACRLGAPVERAPATRARAWRRLADAIQLCAWQGLAVVLAIDNSHFLREGDDHRDLERLVHLEQAGQMGLTVIEVGRPQEKESASIADEWGCSIRLASLMRTEAELYLTAKLSRAGRDENPFSPAAVSRLHSLACGTPRGIDRLGTLCLMAAASQGLDRITPEIVSDAAREFLAFRGSE